MKWTQMLPFIMITLNLAECIRNLFAGQVVMTIYWLSAATLTLCVTLKGAGY